MNMILMTKKKHGIWDKVYDFGISLIVFECLITGLISFTKNKRCTILPVALFTNTIQCELLIGINLRFQYTMITFLVDYKNITVVEI